MWEMMSEDDPSSCRLEWLRVWGSGPRCDRSYGRCERVALEAQSERHSVRGSVTHFNGDEASLPKMRDILSRAQLNPVLDARAIFQGLHVRMAHGDGDSSRGQSRRSGP
jgi:hypothetical protein